MFPASEGEPAAGPALAQPAEHASLPAAHGLTAMRARFMVDFTGGRIGQHHNTFQHRQRVIRQLTAQAQAGGP